MVVLCPVGGAPILKRRRWEVDSTQTVHFITSFIRKKLELHKSDSLVSVPRHKLPAFPLQNKKKKTILDFPRSSSST